MDGIELEGDRAVASYSWTGGEGKRIHWAHVIKLRDGKIADMQDHVRRPSRA